MLKNVPVFINVKNKTKPMIMVAFLAMMVVWLSSQNIYEIKFSHKVYPCL